MSRNVRPSGRIAIRRWLASSASLSLAMTTLIIRPHDALAQSLDSATADSPISLPAFQPLSVNQPVMVLGGVEPLRAIPPAPSTPLPIITPATTSVMEADRAKALTSWTQPPERRDRPSNPGFVPPPRDSMPRDGAPRDGAPREGAPREGRPLDQEPRRDVRDQDDRPKDRGPADRKPEDRKPEDRRPEDRRPEDRRPEDRRPEDRRPDRDAGEGDNRGPGRDQNQGPGNDSRSGARPRDPGRLGPNAFSPNAFGPNSFGSGMMGPRMPGSGPGMPAGQRMAGPGPNAPALEEQLKQLERLLESPVVKRYLELVEENANLRAQVEVNERLLKMEREHNARAAERTERGPHTSPQTLPPEARPQEGQVQMELMELRQNTLRLHSQLREAHEQVERARMAEREMKEQRAMIEKLQAELRTKEEKSDQAMERAKQSAREAEMQRRDAKIEHDKAEAKRKEREKEKANDKKESDKKESDKKESDKKKSDKKESD